MSKKEEKSVIAHYTPIHLIFHCIVGISVYLIAALLFALLISAEKLPYTSIGAAAFFSISSGTFTACFLSAKKFGKPLVSSTLQSSLFMSLTYLSGAVIHSRFIPSNNIFFSLSGCVCGLVLSTITATLTRNTPKRAGTFKYTKR